MSLSCALHESIVRYKRQLYTHIRLANGAMKPKQTTATTRMRQATTAACLCCSNSSYFRRTVSTLSTTSTDEQQWRTEVTACHNRHESTSGGENHVPFSVARYRRLYRQGTQSGRLTRYMAMTGGWVGRASRKRLVYYREKIRPANITRSNGERERENIDRWSRTTDRLTPSTTDPLRNHIDSFMSSICRRRLSNIPVFDAVGVRFRI